MGSFSIWHWLIVLLVVVLIFGTKKLRNIGSDVGGAVKNFKEAMTTEQGQAEANGAGGADHRVMASNLIEAEVSEMPVVKAAPKKRAPAKPAVKKAAAPETTVKPKAPRKPSATTAKIK